MDIINFKGNVGRVLDFFCKIESHVADSVQQGREMTNREKMISVLAGGVL